MCEYFLIDDVINRLNKKQLYGRKGEKVKLISESLPAVIVENEKGDRFPTYQGNITLAKIEKTEEQKIITEIKFLKTEPGQKKLKAIQPKLF